jgi:hypothetical protein
MCCCIIKILKKILFKKKYIKISNPYNNEYRSVINFDYKNISNEEKQNIINILKYIQNNVKKEYMKDIIINYKCEYLNCPYKLNEYNFNYKTYNGFFWSPLLLHYIKEHNLTLNDEFIKYIYTFNSNNEKQKEIYFNNIYLYNSSPTNIGSS